MIVVDANILAFYVIEGKRTTEANALRELDAEWIVPTVWCVEFQSILWTYVRFGGMPTEKALELLDQAIALFSVNEVTPPPDRVLRTAIAWAITVYDAQYVLLAKQVGVRCITEDVPVQKACPGIALSLKDFINRAADGNVVRERQATYRTRRTSKTRKGLPADVP
jgi:predicted nucleic acid-binding protein